MTTAAHDSLATLLRYLDSTTGVRAAGFVIMAWISGSDGEIDANERAFLSRIATGLGSTTWISDVTDLGLRAEPEDIAIACEVLRLGLTDEGKALFFQVCAGMTMADGVVRYAEIYILMLLADLFALTIERVDQLYGEAAGQAFPWKLGDPSRLEHWAGDREKNRRSRSDQQRRASSNASNQLGGRAKALAILGLDEDATPAAIREAYRRLARIHHPDRFEALGPEAVEAANETFRRIQAAYEEVSAK